MTASALPFKEFAAAGQEVAWRVGSQKLGSRANWAATNGVPVSRRAATCTTGQANEVRTMAKSYYSVVLDHPADEVWAVIRPFDHYAWAGVESEPVIEDGKAGDQVGAVRRVTFGEHVRRQMLLAHSDVDRSYTYGFCGAPPFPVRDFMATLRVRSVVADNTSFVEWWAKFDCAAEERDKWVNYFAKEGFAKWLAALRQFMAKRQGRARRGT